jgi:hypothetical protein
MALSFYCDKICYANKASCQGHSLIDVWRHPASTGPEPVEGRVSPIRREVEQDGVAADAPMRTPIRTSPRWPNVTDGDGRTTLWRSANQDRNRSPRALVLV